jgi:hypothetical protein
MRLTFNPHVDHAQQSLVDLVAMRQHLVEVHRAHHRADVGHGQHDDRLMQIGDLVTCLRGIEHLEERDAVHRHGGVVLGDHFLLGNIDHLLHHVHLAADPVEIGDDDVEPGSQRAGVFAEPLDGPVIALRHRLDAGKQRKDHQQHHRNGENTEPVHKALPDDRRRGETQIAPYNVNTLCRAANHLWSPGQDVRFEAQDSPPQDLS